MPRETSKRTYDVDGLFPGADTAAFDAGTSLLVTGETGSSKQLVFDLLARGSTNGESAVLVTTNDGAGTARRSFEDRDAFDPDRVGIIDCTARESDRSDGSPGVRYLSSPGDLTGISLEFAKFVKQFPDPGGPLRVGFSNVSTVLMYANPETVFRFLHVFTSRLRSGDWFGVFTLDPEMHDPQVVNTVRAVFDAEAHVEAGEVELRGVGFS